MITLVILIEEGKMNFEELYLLMIKEQRTGAIEASSGKKKWLFYFSAGELALTKSNLKGEQTATLQEKNANFSASELVLLQAGLRTHKACLADEIVERDLSADSDHSISALDALVIGMSQAYSAEELANAASHMNDIRPKTKTDLLFSDGESLAFMNSLTGTLRSPVAVSNSGIAPTKAWPILWIMDHLDALEEDVVEAQEQIGDVIDFDLDSLLQQEVEKEDLPPTPKAEEGEDVELPQKTKDDLMKETLDELEHHIMEAENHFEILGVAHDAEVEEFGKSFRELSMRLHPDRFIDAEEQVRERATTLFDKVRQAYEVLNDDDKREKYINQTIHGQLSEEEQAMAQLEAYWKADASFNKGKTLFNQGQVSRAHPYFAEAAEASPETLEFVAYYGYTTFSVNRNSKPDEAMAGLETLKRVLELNKEQEIKLDSAWTLMGRAYREKGENEKAIRALRQALKYNPSNPDAVREMKRLTSKSGKAQNKKKTEQKQGFFSRLFGGKKK
jgi:curved DNA-binding protein CbpA